LTNIGGHFILSSSSPIFVQRFRADVFQIPQHRQALPLVAIKSQIMTHPNKFNCLLVLIIVVIFTACRTNDTNSFLQTLSVKTDTLKIDNTKDTLLFGSKGTAIFFEKESFILPDGSQPKGSITLQLKECYQLSDIVRENLTTTSNDKLLETRGMIYIKAFADNQELKLKNDKKFIIHFPKEPIDKNKQMNLFYSNTSSNGTQNWDIDTTSLLKPSAKIESWSETYENGVDIDTAKNASFWNFQDTTKKDIFTFFDSLFDNSKIKNINPLVGKSIIYSFIKSNNGTLKNMSIYEAKYDTASNKYVKVSSNVDSYFRDFINSMPPLKPEKANGVPANAPGEIRVKVDFLPDYKKNSNYNLAFQKKYTSFKNNSIKTMDDLELNYYIFSASKLGWINCDYFWNTNDEKIDYLVKVNPESKTNIKLIFKQARSIMTGTLVGDKYVFKNIPLNQEVKLVAISYKNNQPLLAVTETKINRQEFNNLIYKEFSVTELERQLNLP
jgi:hypothetical protein